MKTSNLSHKRSPRAWLLMAALVAAAPVWAASRGDAAEFAARYRQERADCMKTTSIDDRKACLQDAAVAYAEAKRYSLEDVRPEYAANQIKRCEALTGTERGDCLARMRGQGKTVGSVATGAIYRELTTIEVGEPVAAPPARAQEPAAKN